MVRSEALHIEALGNRFCMAACWVGILHILYMHLG